MEAGTGASLIGVDWGTTAMRAILCRGDGGGEQEPEVLAGPGVAAVQGAFSETLFATIEPWTLAHGKLPVFLSGMVGSSIGWKVVPYLDCPVPVRSLRDALTSFAAEGHRLSMVPGVACRNALDQPDFMRGEELQILGWLELAPERRDGEHILCLPGTHTKWVRFSGGAIETFMTALTGELYAILCNHSILLPRAASATPVAFDESAFAEGLAAARRAGGDLLNTLFSVRSRQLATPGAAPNASSYLSGLVIGADAMSGVRRFEPRAGVVELIGEAALCRKFVSALELLGFGANVTGGSDAACRGFRSLAELRA